jgi:hypothetical protein
LSSYDLNIINILIYCNVDRTKLTSFWIYIWEIGSSNDNKTCLLVVTKWSKVCILTSENNVLSNIKHEALIFRDQCFCLFLSALHVWCLTGHCFQRWECKPLIILLPQANMFCCRLMILSLKYKFRMKLIWYDLHYNRLVYLLCSNHMMTMLFLKWNYTDSYKISLIN